MSKILELADAYAEALRLQHVYADKTKADESRAALVAEVEKLEKDAARYQWLREYLPSDDTGCDDAIVAALTPEELDAVIDAAMGVANEQDS